MTLVPAALAAWVGCAAAISLTTHAGPLFTLAWLAVGAVSAAALRRRRGVSLTLATAAFVVGTVAGAARGLPVTRGPLHDAALDGAVVAVTAVIERDPVSAVRKGGLDWASQTSRTVVVSVRDVRVHGRTAALRVPALLVLPHVAPDLVPGEVVTATGSLSPAQAGRAIAAVLRASEVRIVRGPPRYQWLASVVRARLQLAVSHQPRAWRGLIPGLVLGDTSAAPQGLAADMRAAGLSHLTAVSGANVAVVVGLVAAATARLPRRIRFATMVLAIAAFTVLVRPSPSVVRAAVMGGLAAYAVVRRERAAPMRLLSAAVLVLIVLDPWLAVSYGFALSVLATGSLILWSTRLTGMLRGPRVVVDALAATLCAQLAVLPVLVALGNQVTLASIPANLVAVPLAGAALLSGLAVATLALVWLPLAQFAAWVPGACAAVIAWTARTAVRADWLAVPWPHGVAGVTAAAALVAIVGLAAARWERADDATRSTSVVVAAAYVVLVLVRPAVVPASWPPPDWAVVSCDVGQGDATVVRVGENSAAVIDTGPEPIAVDACLRQLHVTEVPVIVLTHFHADHVGGLEGVLRHRRVGVVYETALADPPMMRVWVASVLRGRSEAVMAFPGRFTLGDVAFQCVWPSRLIIGQGSDANNASIALLVSIRGATFLLPGDAEPAAQDAMLASVGPVDVLKVAHHGSANQSPAFAARVHPRIAVISVGEHNDYGHPAPMTIALYESVGATVLRTDRDGSIAFRVAPGGAVSARGHT